MKKWQGGDANIAYVEDVPRHAKFKRGDWVETSGYSTIYPPGVLEGAIMAHNPLCGKKAGTTIEYALLAADPMSGFCKSVAQIYPDKKIASVKHKSVVKRFKEVRFAAGANREYMNAIVNTGLTLDDLIDVALEEMTAIADQLGL